MNPPVRNLSESLYQFDPLNPFPPILQNQFDYALAQRHAVFVDEWLGFQVEEVERQLIDTVNAQDQKKEWIGLRPSSLQTPYLEFSFLLGLLKPSDGMIVADLGAAYGRLGVVMHFQCPETRFLGIESNASRVQEGNRIFSQLRIQNGKLIQQDMSETSWDLPQAQVYFVYDFGPVEAIQKVLAQIQKRAKVSPVVVVGRGRSSRDLMEREHPWLSQVVPPKHFGNFTIYSSS